MIFGRQFVAVLGDKWSWRSEDIMEIQWRSCQGNFMKISYVWRHEYVLFFLNNSKEDKYIISKIYFI